MGHWRVNFRPLSPVKEQLSLQQCFEAVRMNSVLIRGWDFPHISKRNDDEGGTLRGDTYYEGWCDWWAQHEFWRMYKSSQFIAYNALSEDSPDGDYKRKGTLSILSAIYSMIEFIEFAHRLQMSGLYGDGVSVKIELRNTAGRYLAVSPNRLPFYEKKDTHSPKIIIQREFDGHKLRNDHKNISVDCILEFFDHFGWNPPRDQIERDQARFYSRDFY